MRQEFIKEYLVMNNILVGIINYNSGNIGSVVKAFKFLSIPTTVISSNDSICSISHAVLPGVGAFPTALLNLKSCGFFEELKERVESGSLPILGICVGMQIMFDIGYEKEETKGLGWLKGEVKRLKILNKRVVLPHSGWTSLHNSAAKNNSILPKDKVFYFDHEYECIYEGNGVQYFCDYGGAVLAFVQQGNIFACQFHPEKSGNSGLRVLKNFVHHA